MPHPQLLGHYQSSAASPYSISQRPLIVQSQPIIYIVFYGNVDELGSAVDSRGW